MCGRVGVVLQQNARLPARNAIAMLGDLFQLSESRGREWAGEDFYVPSRHAVWMLREAKLAVELLATQRSAIICDKALDATAVPDAVNGRSAVVAFGYSRLVTNGAAELPHNNEPVRHSSPGPAVTNSRQVLDGEIWRDFC
jgi:glutamine---fructose-6-phosphate transaminase (isomerizing)